MHKKLIILTLAVISVVSLVAQPSSKRPTKEDIFNRKWEFVSEKAALSSADALKVQPLFMELEEQIWQLFAGNRHIFRSQRKKDNAEKVDFEPINDAIVETELSKANLQKTYYLKLKKVIDAETINKLFHAEKAYQRDLIQNMPQRSGRPGGVRK